MLESSVTDRYQTTVPNGVRKALGVQGKDRLAWEIRGDQAIVRRAPQMTEEEEDDPALEPFLRMLADDIEAHPERLQGMPEHLYRSILELTDGVTPDPDDSFEGSIVL
ncbi:type II toxin-antitoxin system PrlF family antitoxin [Longimicrobium sp.]|uniref:type II toxin-antitoxin system PrlF family antitoxin n=1 Tax=Longimicrobium sp. TaxID=2029185 RepID=UPI003B39FABE